MLTILDIAWAAGFIEGEGNFTVNKTGCPIIRADQVQREPLERLQRMFGGHLRERPRAHLNPKWQDAHVWQCNGSKAAGLAMTLWALLSPRRQEQVERMLSVWKAADTTVRARMQTHCIHGHEFTPSNTKLGKVSARGHAKRNCRACNAAIERRRYAALRNMEGLQPLLQ